MAQRGLPPCRWPPCVTCGDKVSCLLRPPPGNTVFYWGENLHCRFHPCTITIILVVNKRPYSRQIDGPPSKPGCARIHSCGDCPFNPHLSFLSIDGQYTNIHVYIEASDAEITNTTGTRGREMKLPEAFDHFVTRLPISTLSLSSCQRGSRPHQPLIGQMYYDKGGWSPKLALLLQPHGQYRCISFEFLDGSFWTGSSPWYFVSTALFLKEVYYRKIIQ